MTIIRTAAGALFGIVQLFAPQAFAADDGPAEGPTGVAIVASPEMGSGVCFETTPEEGFACAKAKCEAVAGDQADQCTPVRWCLPALYGADIVVNNSEGFTYHEYLCDEDDEAALLASARRICEAAFAAAANACEIASAWDVDGQPLTLPAGLSDPAEQ